MVLLGSLVLILNLFCQTNPGSAAGDDIFIPQEMAQLKQTDSVERRIKIYRAASIRIQKNLQQSVANEQFDTIPDTLKAWTLLLARSIEDIEANLKTKKKPRSLITYEIQLREAINDTQGYKIKAPADQQDAFDSCLAQAESMRKKLVEILFRLKS